MFEVPIVLFIFKRGQKAAKIIERLSQIKPPKLYIIADGPRNESEQPAVMECRKEVEQAINWDCHVVKNYAENNRGVYENIAGGAKWVLEREKWAIFLEDDNMPELTFFPFCQEMLQRYESDSKIVWICGTNYEVKSSFPDNASYTFTQNMMPCGWATWAHKFLKFYDGELSSWTPEMKGKIKQSPYYKPLMAQDMNNWDTELAHKARFGRFASWDYQMSFTIRAHQLLGIVPKYNQITNIGVDELSIHGGTSFDNEMTRRFCGLRTKPLEFPLIHPTKVVVVPAYEYAVAKIITLPWKMRMKGKTSAFLKKIFNVDPFDSFTQTIIKRLFHRK